ncbi:hypothetical protein [Lederbergia lenta]|uniref:hypothetical protein n=1 Tax=Lederbergia lenta TaxID=1467 RepID=UPI00203E29BA|nr:hypothetical protein [Lederbergia lenta]MCM3109976.1 hypothetical protein [Lederbergia lenta]
MYLLNQNEKLDLIIKKSWELFISQYVCGRIIVTKEAPFQHNFANIIKHIGDLHCFSRNEQFFVDLEEKESGILGKNKYIDIVCSLSIGEKRTSRAAIELKFKKKSQGADDEARIDAYADIQSLEHCLDKDYDLAYFFMITDNPAYTRVSVKLDSTASQFSIRDNFITPINIELVPKLKSKSKVRIFLRRRHELKWKNHKDRYFLMIPIHKGDMQELEK